ncbi:MAG: aldo/keto reductase [Thermoleophilaceae bacterium]
MPELELTPLGLGTVALAAPYGAPGAERAAPDRRQAAEAIEVALDAGVRVIDTAPAYGEAETIVGDVAGAAGCVIATKLAIPPAGWHALREIETRDAVRASAHASLAALRRDTIDLLQVHNADEHLVQRGWVLEELEALRAEGLVRMTGATVYGEANALAALDGFDAVQVAYNALDRRPEERVLPAARERGRRVFTRSSLLRGVLSAAGRDLNGPFRALREAANRFREAAGATWEELPGAATAWAAQRPGVDCTLLGPRDACELRELLDGAERFRERTAGLDFRADELPPDLLDPSRWPG